MGQKHLKAREERLSYLERFKMVEDFVFINPPLERK
jgi:hypothetical protein